MKFGYSMPSAAPLYPAPPFHYENNQVISIVFRTAPEVLQELVDKYTATVDQVAKTKEAEIMEV